MKTWNSLIVAAFAAIMLLGCGSVPSSKTSGTGIDLDAAIKEAAGQMEAKIPSKTMIALVSVASSSAQFSEYVISRLEAALVSGGKLVVVDRANLDKVREEQGFQLSGEVDDNSAKNIGKLLGAGAIVTGTFGNLGDVYNLTIKAINIETAMVAVSYPADIAKSKRIETLLASGGGAAGTQKAQRASTGGSTTAQAPAAPVPAVPATPVGPKNGTYTFRPRLRANQGGRDINCYLDRIVVRSGYFTVYVVGNPTGRGTDAGSDATSVWWIPSWMGGLDRSKISIQNLDSPSRTWIPVNSGHDPENEGGFMTFQGVTAVRFTLINKNREAPIDFGEITLGEPD